ncbi:MAG: YdhR family protein [Burkholderiales bacterium]|nr:YdhR family protein [Burkholderiales bacterium]
MSVLLQVNFVPSEKQKKQTPAEKAEAAKFIAGQPGLQWKVWIHNESSQIVGGIYLFEDLKSAKVWGDDLLRKRLTDAGSTDISIQYFDIHEEASLITRAPIAKTLKAA